MGCLLGVMLISATWGPAPVAKALDSTPGFCRFTHGYVTGFTAARFGYRPFIP